MVDTPYSGTAVRGAHYSYRPSTLGVDAAHLASSSTSEDGVSNDIFNPLPETPPNQANSPVTQDVPYYGSSIQPMVGQPIGHWFDGEPAVQSGLPYAQGQLAMQERMFVDHEQSDYVPDSIRLYQHYSEGQDNEWIIGRPSIYSGATVPDGPLAGLQNGRNGYDATNAPNEVYAGDAANVGRYRLGVKTNIWGLYENPHGKFGQDNMLRAYTGLSPALPVDKPPMTDTAPYTPNSTGRARWWPSASWNDPSLFGLPAETAVTDFSVANDAAISGSSDFTDGDILT